MGSTDAAQRAWIFDVHEQKKAEHKFVNADM
jgi:hypothetical protein